MKELTAARLKKEPALDVAVYRRRVTDLMLDRRHRGSYFVE